MRRAAGADDLLAAVGHAARAAVGDHDRDAVVRQGARNRLSAAVGFAAPGDQCDALAQSSSG